MLGSLAMTGVLAHAEARMVLTIAAAYGLDPTDEEDRGTELLRLLRVPRLTQPTTDALRNSGRIVAALAARRVAARLVPFGAVLAGAVQGVASSNDVAMRALAYYRGYKNGRRSFSSV
jgi:hypothetical protein